MYELHWEYLIYNCLPTLTLNQCSELRLSISYTSWHIIAWTGRSLIPFPKPIVYLRYIIGWGMYLFIHILDDCLLASADWQL